MNQKNQFKIILLLSICLILNKAFSQTIPTQIDFETVVNGVDGGSYNYSGSEPWSVGSIPNTSPNAYSDFNDYFWQNYNVRFWSGSLNSGNTPNIAQIGNPIGGYTYPNPNGGSDNVNPSPLVQPPNFTGIGSYFLSTFQQDQTPQPLFVDYNEEKIQCSQASGFVLDIDGSESWVIDVFSTTNTFPVASIVICSPSNINPPSGHPTHSTHPNLGSIVCNTDYENIGNTSQAITVFSGDGIATFWSVDVSAQGQIIDYLRFTYTGTGKPGLGFDNFSFCTIPEGDYCCEGENLIVNGNFESGDIGFNSDYNSISPGNPVNPKEYAVIDFNNANTICSTWNVEDHTHCKSENNNQIMVVNGQTQQIQNQNNIVWEQTVQVQTDSLYRFCVYVKDLPQCCFNINPIISIEISPPGITTNFPPVNTTNPSNPNDPCSWQELSTSFTATSNSVTIRIRVDEMGLGDGSDFALDDISLTIINCC